MIRDFNMIYSSDPNYYIQVREGSGDNLDDEDEKNGFVDYIYYTIMTRKSKEDKFKEEDGGMILLKHLYQEFENEEEVAKEVAEFIRSQDVYKRWTLVTEEGEPI